MAPFRNTLPRPATWFARLQAGEGTCFVEYVGGQVRAFEVDRFLVERLIEHLEQRGL